MGTLQIELTKFSSGAITRSGTIFLPWSVFVQIIFFSIEGILI
jgi:hypothetical protein